MAVTTKANLPSRTSCPMPARGGGGLIEADGALPALAADVLVDDDVELLLLLCEPASPMTISTAMTAKTITHLGTDCFFFGNPPTAGGGAAGPQVFLPSQ